MIDFKTLSLSKVTEILFLNFFLFPVYPDNLKPTFITLFFIFSFFYYVKHNYSFSSRVFKTLIINSSIFFVLLISLTYSSNYKQGLQEVFRSLPLLLFPLSFYFVKSHLVLFSRRIFNKGKILFYCSTLILFLTIVLIFYLRGFVTKNFFLNYSYRITFQLGKYSMHPIYASLVTSIALVFSISLLKLKKYKWYILIGNILLVLNLILLSRKSAIIIMIILSAFYFLNNRRFSIRLKVAFVTLLISSFFIIIKFVPDIANRFNDFRNLSNNSKVTSTNLRINLIELSLNSIKEKPVFGFGVGDVRDHLTKLQSYQPIYNGNYYNTHNQFLAYAVSSGIVGLSFFTFFCYANIRINLKEGYENIYIVIIFVLIMLIENILDRQNGIIYFSLLINYFAFSYQINRCNE